MNLHVMLFARNLAVLVACICLGAPLARLLVMGVVWLIGRLFWGKAWDAPINYREWPITRLMCARLAYEQTFHADPLAPPNPEVSHDRR